MGADPGPGRHQGQGFGGTALTPAQGGDGRSIAGIHQQLEAPHALHGNDLSTPYRRCGCGDACPIALFDLVGLPDGIGLAAPVELGPAGGAAQGLGVEAAIGGILVIGLAGPTQGQGRQTGVDPLEGQLVEHAVAGPAIGATDERVAVAPVGGVLQFGQAGRAGGQIRADKGRCPSGPAGGRS